MDNLIDFVSYLALVSVSVERGTELIKKFLLSRFEITNGGVYQFAAFVLGGAFCWASPPSALHYQQPVRPHPSRRARGLQWLCFVV